MSSLFRTLFRYGALAVILIPSMTMSARAQEHHDHALAHGSFPGFVDLFSTHHAYLERKIHLRLDTTLAEEAREYSGSGELVWQFHRRFGGEVEGGFVTQDPETGESAWSVADVEVAPILALVQDPDRLLIVSVRSGFVLPTGDEDEGLGIEGWGWEPGLLVWKGFGPEGRAALQAEVGYERVFADQGTDEQEMVINVGVSYWLPSDWIPIVEISIAEPLGNDASEEHEENTQFSALLGFRYAFANGQQWGAGIQLPLTDTDAYDARIVVGGIIHVE